MILYPILNYLYKISNSKEVNDEEKEFSRFVFARLYRGFVDEKRK